ncbi:MAG: hypothetical protein GYA24_03350 [Candidatus Lokiarchaeota archaeon]|nr:hypothetical protein [Candidatus Lokiarchaeota archaeon]
MIIEKPSDEKYIDDDELKSIIRRKIALAEQFMVEGRFDAAAQAFKEAAETSFELGEIEEAMRLLDRREDALKQRSMPGSRIGNYLHALQVEVDASMKAGKLPRARDLLKQMQAIAEQGRDIPAIKAIKRQLTELQASTQSMAVR